MPLYRAQVSVAVDGTLPRDRIVNTLYFNDAGVGTDPNNLANDLAVVWNDHWNSASASEVDVRFYDMAQAKPRPIAGRKVLNAGLSRQSQMPRELAVCLSFFAERNLPRQRGRLYMSPAARGLSSAAARPADVLLTDLLGMANAFSALGGVDVDWVVYSPTNNSHKKVTEAWVDDEWDVVRSRGLRASKRSKAAQGG